MRPSGETSVISANTSARAADGAAAEVHEVPIVRHAILAEYWHIGETTTRFSSFNPRS